MNATRTPNISEADEATLPTLWVSIERDGKEVRRVKFEDPRQNFCKLFNSEDLGETARPVE